MTVNEPDGQQIEWWPKSSAGLLGANVLDGNENGRQA
jgi:hypothetical protein